LLRAKLTKRAKALKSFTANLSTTFREKLFTTFGEAIFISSVRPCGRCLLKRQTGRVKSARAINQGRCEPFAHDVLHRLGRPADIAVNEIAVFTGPGADEA